MAGCIRFEKLDEAMHYKNVCHSKEYAKKLKVERSRYFSIVEWQYFPCWVVVRK